MYFSNTNSLIERAAENISSQQASQHLLKKLFDEVEENCGNDHVIYEQYL